MAPADSPHPRVGTAALIVNGSGQVLVGKRQGSHGAGTWQLPGGHLEYGEDVIACAERETKEETDVDVKGSNIVAVTNDVFEKEGKHYITLFVWCEMHDANATPKVMEPNKCDGWFWKTWEELKALSAESTTGEELFLPLRHLVEQRSSIDDLKVYRG